MNQPTPNQPEEAAVCPDCGGELWFDEEEDCWVCDECDLEFYEEEWEEYEEGEPEEGEPGGK
jgi:ribosomal protein L37AE/L43A